VSKLYIGMAITFAFLALIHFQLASDTGDSGYWFMCGWCVAFGLSTGARALDTREGGR